MEKTSAFVINENNWDASAGVYRVSFQQSQEFFETQIALIQVSMYNSFGNIFSSTGNNTFSLFYPDGAGHTEFVLTCPDGFYNASRFYDWLKREMQTLKLYTIGSDGKTKDYGITIDTNNSYQVMFGFYSISQVATQPNDAPWSLPTSSNKSPYLVMPSKMASIFGFTYTQLGDGGATQFKKSDTNPQPYTINSVIMSCNMISNQKLSNPYDMISSFAVANVGYGSLISYSPADMDWMEVPTNQSFTELVITFRDQNFNKLNLVDTNAMILIAIKEKRKKKI